MVFVIDPGGRLQLEVTQGFNEDLATVYDGWMSCLRKHAACYLLWGRHPVDLSQMLVQKTNPGSNVPGNKPN